MKSKGKDGRKRKGETITRYTIPSNLCNNINNNTMKTTEPDKKVNKNKPKVYRNNHNNSTKVQIQAKNKILKSLIENKLKINYLVKYY